MPKQHPDPFSTFLRTIHSALCMAASRSVPHGTSWLGDSAIVIMVDLVTRLMAVVGIATGHVSVVCLPSSDVLLPPRIEQGEGVVSSVCLPPPEVSLLSLSHELRYLGHVSSSCLLISSTHILA